ncbi:YicC family protein [Hahella sp. CCB-MM4]|uniref:YicC/YloC family endoribonuclease n=1 Tax=Hahella sp. (strain CCB-MM4) TaxID=1926491 RepID=UPI000B9C3B59|nr:YicC/YloC family endoribonuclease [Hahella sp. CCB-MM4]OZG74247.1 YicC family protein [Hahella sp. CCB-MM4]
MIRSMTAYARQDARGEWGTLTWELRSVNHRYLEPVFRIPEALRDIEPALRDRLRHYVQRGKLECQLKFQPEAQGSGSFSVNVELAAELNHAVNQINRLLDNPAHINAFDFINWPGVMVSEETDLEPVKEEAVNLFNQALSQLVDTREREGGRIHPMLDDRLNSIAGIVEKVREKMPHILERQNEALKSRFEELQLDVDPTRLEQELVMVSQKADVAEELDRLEAHVHEVKDVLTKKEPVGRRLDFLMQELNREANTLSSKSLVTETTQFAVELKVLIEQMREQVQNIE